MKKEVDKSKTLVKFGFYMLFLLVVILLIITTGAYKKEQVPTNKNEEVHKKTYVEKQKDLSTLKYNYIFIIDDGIVTYNGIYENGIRKGQKKENDVTIQYEESDNTYKIVNKEKILYDDLYENLDDKMFNLSSLFEVLNAENCHIERTDETTTYAYADILDHDYLITANNEHIIKIEIEGTHKYNFEFTY